MEITHQLLHLFSAGFLFLRRRIQHRLISGYIVKRICFQIFRNPGAVLSVSSQHPEHCCLQAPRFDVVGVLDKSLLHKIKSRLVISFSAGNDSQIIPGHLLLLIRPGRLVEAVEGLVVFLLIELAQSQIVIGFAVIGIGASPGKTMDSCLKIPFRLRKTASPQQQHSVGIIDADIIFIPL